MSGGVQPRGGLTMVVLQYIDLRKGGSTDCAKTEMHKDMEANKWVHICDL